MSSDIQTGDIRLDSNGAPYLSEKPSSNMVHITYQHFSALDIGVKYTTLFATEERDMVNGINSLFGTNFTWGRLDSKTHDFFNPVSKDPFIRLRFSNVGEFYVAQVVVDDNLQIEGAKPSTEIGEMLLKEGRPKYDTAYFASRENISVLTSFMHTNFSTRHMSFNPSRDIDSAFLSLAEDDFLTPVVLQNYRNNGGYSTLLFKNEVLPAIELDVKVYSRERVAIALGAKLGVKLSEKNFTQYDMVHVFDPYKGVNEEYTIFKLTRGEDVKYMAAVTAVEVNVKPVEPEEPETPDIPWTPIDPSTPIVKPKVDLSQITNGHEAGIWNVELASFDDLVTEQENIVNDILTAINLKTDRGVVADDLIVSIGDDHRITITAADKPITKVTGTLVAVVTETVVEVPPLAQINLSEITNNDTPGEWSVEVASEEERESEYDNIIASVLVAINEGSEQNVTLEDLVIYTDSSNNIFIASVTEDDNGKVIGTLVVKIKVVIQEEPITYGPTGLKADYPGTGWYKATDTGTVFCKDVPALETCVFEVDGLEYVSVYTSEDAKRYGERAATSNVTDMSRALSNMDSIGDITSWDVSNVTTMYDMFSNFWGFNQDISKWDVSSVTDMGSMFYAVNQFNQDISGWDVSNVTNMDYMFRTNAKMNQDLSGWCVANILVEPTEFSLGNNVWTKPKPVWGTCPRHEDGSVPVEPLSPIDLSQITNNDTPGEWRVTVGSYEERETEYDRIVADMLVVINSGYELDVTLADLNVYTDSSGSIYMTSIVDDDSGKVIGLLKIYVDVVEEEIVDVQGFKFHTSSPDTAQEENPISIAIGTNSWELYENNKLIATPTSYSENITVEAWGKGHKIGITGLRGRDVTHTVVFASLGIDGLTISNHYESNRSFELLSWGDVGKSFKFRFNSPMFVVPATLPKRITGLDNMFTGCKGFNADISSWDVSHVTSMYSAFGNCTSFNQDLSGWDTSKVTTMNAMFHSCTAFNQDISMWNTSNVTTMSAMFNSCTAFNQDISMWNTSKVTDMGYMFYNAKAFSQDLSDWCVGNISTKHTSFETGSALTPEQLPIWGTCPRGENAL